MNKDLRIVFVLFPRITQLDFTGPHEVLWRAPDARCVLASSAGGRIQADGGLAFDTVPIADVDGCELLLVPGGYGTLDAMADAHLLAQMRRLAAGARHVVSVCTGSLLLGAAGLLQGYRATCHWASHELLGLVGAQPVDQRVVVDHNRVTGAGVTSGLDCALAVIGLAAGDTVAQGVQLFAEYDPQPPYDAGAPHKAPPEIVAAMRAKMRPLVEARRTLLAARRPPPPRREGVTP